MIKKHNLDLKLSQEEIKKIAVLVLNKISNPEKGLGEQLFNAIARLTVSVALEAVCLRFNPENNKIEVYLTRRSKRDASCPDQWHCPGSILRPGEQISKVFKRLENKEFNGGHLLKTQFVANFNNIKEDRGHFFSLIYLCTLKQSKRSSGRWFPVDQLPDKTAMHHVKIVIPMAVKALFKNRKTK